MVETTKLFRLVVEFTIEEEYYSVFKDFDDLDGLQRCAASVVRNDCAVSKFHTGFAAIAKWLFNAAFEGWMITRNQPADYTYCLGIEYCGRGDQLLNYIGIDPSKDHNCRHTRIINFVGLNDNTDYAALADIAGKGVCRG